MDRWTIRRILEWTSDYFRARGVQTPRLDAEILLSHVLEKDRLYLYLNLERPLTGPERAAYKQVVARRANRAPCSLIIGAKEFWSMDFKIDQGVLSPRPETEILVERCLKILEDAPDPIILELGLGSAAISASLASEIGKATIIGIELSPPALACARENISILGFADRIHIVAGDLFGPIRQGPLFDLIVSNPPYIPTDHIAGLEPEVRDYEPMVALDGGLDGLEPARVICSQAPKYLKPGGYLALEIGVGQETQAMELLRESGEYQDAESYPDLSRIPRVITARKRP
jgi:release factor glutamine methyltransferase